MEFYLHPFEHLHMVAPLPPCWFSCLCLSGQRVSGFPHRHPMRLLKVLKRWHLRGPPCSRGLNFSRLGKHTNPRSTPRYEGPPTWFQLRKSIWEMDGRLAESAWRCHVRIWVLNDLTQRTKPWTLS